MESGINKGGGNLFPNGVLVEDWMSKFFPETKMKRKLIKSEIWQPRVRCIYPILITKKLFSVIPLGCLAIRDEVKIDLNSFCPDCGKDIQKRSYLSLMKKRLIAPYNDKGSGVAKCVDCGCRVSYYDSGEIIVWHTGGKFASVPRGTLLVGRGTEL